MAARKPTPQTLAFGAEVTRLRQQARLSRADLAQGAAVSRSYITQVENGTTRCRQDFAERLDRVLDSGTALADTWEDLLASSRYPAFFANYPSAEASAVLLRGYDETYVYGPFQVTEYLRELAEDDEVAEARIRRQKAILAETGTRPTIAVVLGEAVLLREVGASATMRKQLSFLLEVSEWPNVVLQVAPIARYRGVSGSFYLATQKDGRDLAHLETSTGGTTTSDPSEVLHLESAFARLQAKALDLQASRERLREVTQNRWT
ncbi:Scr1 family TA system antitoxin-like transcriptional regulator [Actinomadura sp. 6N118]|uniref:helix-turn-helix domain-containing protein n=1 Tax=Actinomadura sp. 6N118 TaxID=3375151 RepID=UPI0037A2C39D